MSIYMQHSYPKEVEKAKKEKWPVLLPVGTMEYHSAHCPFGCDALVSMGIADELAKKTECMVLPPVWYGVSSYAVGGPEKNTIHVDCDVFEAYMYSILESLFKSGFRRNIYILIFHQTEEFLPMALACMKAAKKLTFKYLEETEGVGWWGDNKYAGFYEELSSEDSPWNWIRVINGACYPEAYEYPSDHAGVYECSMLEKLFPGSIRLDRLPETDDWFAQTAKDTSVELGAELVDKVVNSILESIQKGKRIY